MAKREIEKLLSQTGHNLSIDDFKFLKNLNEAADCVTNPASEDGIYPCLPVRLGGHLFVPPTISIIQWYSHCAIKWWENSGYWDFAIGYALQIHISGEWLWQQDRKFLEKEIRRFSRKLNCSTKEYETVIKSIINSESDDSTDDNSGDESEGFNNYGPLISLLCREFGNSPDYWIHEADMNTIKAFRASYLSKIESEYKQMSKSSKKATLPPFKTPKMAALENFRKVSNLVRVAWQKS